MAALRWEVDLDGAQHVPVDGGAVLTWNHTSHLDAPVTAAVLLPRTHRWVRLFALRQLWDRPVIGPVLRLAGCVPVDRDGTTGGLAAMRTAVEAARAGELVMLAPESTISGSLELLPFRPGAVRIAQLAGVPIVPTASLGTHRFSTTGRSPSLRAGWRLPVAIRVGRPMTVARDEDPHAATARLRGSTAALLDECRVALSGRA